MVDEYDEIRMNQVEKDYEQLEQAAYRIALKRQAGMEQQAVLRGLKKAQAELGVDDATFQQLMNADPELRVKSAEENAYQFAKGIAGHPRGKDGKFLSKGRAETERTGQRQEPPSAAEREERLQSHIEARKKGTISSDQYLHNLINSVMPKDDPIWRTK